MSAVLEYVYPRVLDVRQVFADLTEKGVRPFRVATLLGKEWASVQRWLRDGVEPRASEERALLELHTKHCGAELTQRRLAEARPKF